MATFVLCKPDSLGATCHQSRIVTLLGTSLASSISCKIIRMNYVSPSQVYIAKINEEPRETGMHHNDPPTHHTRPTPYFS
mmetsp:Transcript_41404/g.67181  ORF Transcript_41404/g.67181 Transcript_41404/m.67181 type:complete len:80 (-) Transcript_41404:3932-4171(-)